jgi:hypothetical protein
MSTRINVNIGDGGLLDRNAQQQAAARQANQQRASADKAAAEGQRQLEAVRISQGRDPVTGERLPSAGSSSRIQRIDQEPAANRRSILGLDIGSMWFFTEPPVGIATAGWRFAPGFLVPGGVTGINARLLTFTGFSFGNRSTVYLGSADGSTWITDVDGAYGSYPLTPSGPIFEEAIRLPEGERDECGDRFALLNPQPFTGCLTFSSGNNANYFALPAGGKNFILVRFNSYQYDFITVSAQGYREGSGNYVSIKYDSEFGTASHFFSSDARFFCYFCTPTSITQIAVPPSIVAAVDAISSKIAPLTSTLRTAFNAACNNLDIPAVERVENFTNSGGGYNSLSPQFLYKPSILNAWPGYPTFAWGAVPDIVYTPAVYEAINEAIQFTSPSNIKSFPSNFKWGMPDGSNNSAFEIYRTSTGNTTSKVVDAYADPRPFRYARWPQPNVEPDQNAWDEGYTGPTPIKIKSSTEFKSPQRPARTGPYASAQRILTIDWDDKAYCRARLQELGFNLNQLT